MTSMSDTKFSHLLSWRTLLAQEADVNDYKAHVDVAKRKS